MTDIFDIPDDPGEEVREHMEPLCCRCYSDAPLFPANCAEKPELLVDVPIGMYHCPNCGAMVLAGVEHGPLCQLCIDRKNPEFE